MEEVEEEEGATGRARVFIDFFARADAVAAGRGEQQQGQQRRVSSLVVSLSRHTAGRERWRCRRAADGTTRVTADEEGLCQDLRVVLQARSRRRAAARPERQDASADVATAVLDALLQELVVDLC